MAKRSVPNIFAGRSLPRPRPALGHQFPLGGQAPGSDRAGRDRRRDGGPRLDQVPAVGEAAAACGDRLFVSTG